MDDGRWQHIVEGFKLRTTGLSFLAIAQNRCDAGFTTKKGGYVSQAKWAEILINPFYSGRMIYLGKEYPHKYDVIIEPWLWEKVQQVNRERNKSHTKYNAKPYLLKKLRCAECGCTVSFEGPKSKGQLIYGKCTASSRQHKPSYVNESLLLEQIREKLRVLRYRSNYCPKLLTVYISTTKTKKTSILNEAKN